MNTKLYTNTGKVESIVGLIVTTVAVTYAASHSTEIVNGTVNIIKTGWKKGSKVISKAMTKEVEVWSTLPNGEKFNTGMKVRVSKFQKLDHS